MTASLNPHISLFGEKFDAGKSSQYRMAIQFALDGLSFALLDTQSQALVGFECYLSDSQMDGDDLFRTLEQALEAKGLNNNAFQSVSCVVDNRFCTLVPVPLFNEAEKKQYLDFAFNVPEDYVILSELLVSAQCRNAFAFPKVLHDKVLTKWKEAKITHSSSVFIESLMQKRINQGVFVNVRNYDFDMVILENGKLRFFNNFKFKTKEDFVYFLLFAMEQNGLSGQDMPVSFTGLILPSSKIIDLCRRYLKVVRFVEQPEFKDGKGLNGVPFQYYYIHYQVLR